MLDIGRDIDLFTEQSIQVTRRVKDFSDITAKEGEFTRTFQGPASRRNQQALQNYGILGTNSEFDPHKGIACVWTFSSFAKFFGRLEVTSVVYKDGQPYSFTFNFYGRQRSLANVFGADRFSDVDWSDFDHSLTYAAVKTSWVGALFSGDLLYPLVDTRANYYFGPSDQDIQGNISNENNPILLTDLKPAIKISTLFTTIFENYGQTLVGDILTDSESPFEGAYVLPNRWSGSGIVADFVDENYVAYQATANTIITDPNSEQIVEFDTEIQDENNLWDGDTFAANLDGDYQFSASHQITLTGTPNIGQYSISIRVNGVEVNKFSVIRDPADIQIFTIQIPGLIIPMETGDTLEWFLMRESVTVGITTFNGQPCRVFTGSMTIQAPTNVLGNTVSLSDQMPDDKLVDWIGAFVKSWNLVIIPSETNETEWTLISVRDYYAAGTQRNWKGYIDIANMTFNKPKVYKEINIGYTPSEAAIQVAFKSATGRDFGTVNIRPDVEFGETKLDIVNPTTLVPPSLFKIVDEAGVPTGEFADVTIHKSINIEGNPTKEPWLFFYYNGTGATAFPYYLQDGLDGPTPTSLIQYLYPHISAVQDFDVQQNSQTLCFSLESSLTGIVAENTTYRRSWESELQVQYAKESRMLVKARIVLPTLEFYNYQLNDEIFLENQWWRIEEIAHDQDGKNATVTLMTSRKLLPDIVRTVLPGGKITFNRTPNALDKSAAGAYAKGANLYGSFIRAQITPNLAKYGDIVNNLSQNLINEINEIGGRFRSWDDEES